MSVAELEHGWYRPGRSRSRSTGPRTSDPTAKVLFPPYRPARQHASAQTLCPCQPDMRLSRHTPPV
eukprot:2364249-Rhodomonas_salina.2